MYKNRKEMLTNPRPHKELADEFIASLDLEDTTLTSYGNMLKRYVSYLDANHIEKPLEPDLIKYKKKIKEDCHSATTQKYVIILRQFYKWTERMDYYPNVSVGLKGERIEPTFKRVPLSEDEAYRLISFAEKRSDKNIRNLRDYAILVLILMTGLRTVEVSRADVIDLVEQDGFHYLYIQGKGHDAKDDQVKVPDTAYKVIQEYLEKRNSDAKPMFLNHGTNVKDARIEPRTISVQIKHMLRAIGIDDKRKTAHSLRHTCATIALLNGAKYEEVQMVLRHKSINTTTIYAHNIERGSNNVELIVEKAINKNKK